MKKYVFSLMLILVLCFATPAFAQVELDETYVAPNGAYFFRYPSDWQILSEEDSSVTLSGDYEGDLFVLTVYPPFHFNRSDKSTFALLTEISLEENFSDVREVKLGAKRGIRANYADGEEVTLGIWGILEQGVFAPLFLSSLDGNASSLESGLPLVIEIVESYDTDVPERLLANLLEVENYSRNWQRVIEELEANQLIGRGGSLVFQENYLFLEMRNSDTATLMPLGRNSQRTNVVISAELTLIGNGGCSLFARIPTADNTIYHYLEVGILDDLGLFYFDANSPDETYRPYPIDGLDLQEPHYLMLILQEDLMTVFLDGRLVAHRVPAAASRGMYAFGVANPEQGTRCEARQLWVHEAPVFTSGVCQAFAATTINRRSGPGTNYERAGTMNAGVSMLVIDSERANDGFLWYQLENETWVREDLIQVNGDCDNFSPVR